MQEVRGILTRSLSAVRQNIVKWTAGLGRTSLNWLCKFIALVNPPAKGFTTALDYRIRGCYLILQGAERNLVVKCKPINEWSYKPYVGSFQGLLRNMVPWYMGNADRPGLMYLKLRTTGGQTYWTKFSLDSGEVQHKVHLPSVLVGSLCPMLFGAAIMSTVDDEGVGLPLGWRFIGCFQSVTQWMGPNEDGSILPGCHTATAEDVLDDMGYDADRDCLLLIDCYQRAFILGGRDRLKWPGGISQQFSAINIPSTVSSDAVDWKRLLPIESFAPASPPAFVDSVPKTD